MEHYARISVSMEQSSLCTIDEKGSIVALSDESGAVVETYSYSPYGEASVTTPAPGQAILFVPAAHGR